MAPSSCAVVEFAWLLSCVSVSSIALQIMISTFEVVLKDASVLNKIKWSFMMVRSGASAPPACPPPVTFFAPPWAPRLLINTVRRFAPCVQMDEAHRLKNHESALYVELMSWHFKNTLLVTGTPLQNSIQELWALLHFLEPDKFHDMEAFVEMHSLDSDQGIASLHRELGPHLLRRVIKARIPFLPFPDPKAFRRAALPHRDPGPQQASEPPWVVCVSCFRFQDVEKSLPPKIERILRVEMTPLQKQYYKWILNRNFQALNKVITDAWLRLRNRVLRCLPLSEPMLNPKRIDDLRLQGARGSGHVSLLNIITELKKTCNHPFLFESAEESYRGRDDGSAIDRLVSTSGKMVILDKLLQRLKATGHRVLIFSQMVRVLDIISEYLRLRGYCHQRLDGSNARRGSAPGHEPLQRRRLPGLCLSALDQGGRPWHQPRNSRHRRHLRL